MTTTEKWTTGAQAALMGTEMDSLANNAAVPAASAFSNAQGGAGDGYVFCDLELVVTFAAAPAANTGVSLWLLRTQDGVNFEDGATGVVPARAPDVVFPTRGVTTAQRIIRQAWLPAGVIKALVLNDGSGVAFSTGNTLKIRPITRQGV